MLSTASDAGSRPAATQRRGVSVVAHVLPYDGIGGVEAAAASLPAGRHGEIEFHKIFIARRDEADKQPFIHTGPLRSENRVANYAAAVRALCHVKPAIVIASLWRGCLAAVAYKLLRPRCKLVLFLHLPTPVHALDSWATRLALSLSAEVWADSVATLRTRLPQNGARRERVISYLIRHHEPQPPAALVGPSFIFWGRLDRQKRLDRALRLIAAIRDRAPDVHFRIIGPDRGEEGRLRELCRTLAIEAHVDFTGPLTWPQIVAAVRDRSFYLQTSDSEGFALAVAEAMQLGLVPVVTPVGEIARYCRDGDNAILVSEDAQKDADRILALAADPARYRALAETAARSWCGRPTYAEDVLAACRNVQRSRA